MKSVIVETQSILAQWWIASDWQLRNPEPVIRNMIYFTTKLASLFFWWNCFIEGLSKEIFLEIPLVKSLSETYLNIQHWIPIIWIIIDILKSTIFYPRLFQFSRHFPNSCSDPSGKHCANVLFSAWCCKYLIWWYPCIMHADLSCQLVLMYAAQYATLNVSNAVLMICVWIIIFYLYKIWKNVICSLTLFDKKISSSFQ